MAKQPEENQTEQAESAAAEAAPEAEAEAAVEGKAAKKGKGSAAEGKAPKGGKVKGAAAKGGKPEAEKGQAKAGAAKGEAAKGEKAKGAAAKGEKAKGAVAKGGGEGASAKAPPRLLAKYRQEVIPALIERFGYKNRMQAPNLVKVTLNMGVGEATRDVKVIESAEEELALIAGQKAKRTRARVSVANFKVRKGMPVGCIVTLRGHRMWEFLDRLINISIPRVRDFRGISPNSFDGRGNHSFGVREHIIFLELDLNKVAQTRGMNINTTTTAKTDQEAHELLRLLGMPFRGA